MNNQIQGPYMGRLQWTSKYTGHIWAQFRNLLSKYTTNIWGVNNEHPNTQTIYGAVTMNIQIHKPYMGRPQWTSKYTSHTCGIYNEHPNTTTHGRIWEDHGREWLGESPTLNYSTWLPVKNYSSALPMCKCCHEIETSLQEFKLVPLQPGCLAVYWLVCHSAAEHSTPV